MNLRDLEYFVAVADLGHFGLAAERCHVSQPTLSGQLKKLENELDQSLFERDTRNVRLTAFGKEILPLARRALEATGDIGLRAAARRDPFCGPVTLGAFPTLAPWFLPRIAPLMMKAYPQAAFYLSEEKSATLQAQVEAGDLDLALLALPLDSSALEVIPLFDEDFLLAVPDAHPWARRRTVAEADLTGTELLLLSEGHCLRDQALDLCRRFGAREGGQFRATSLETLRQMVRMGRGITLIPRLAIPECAEPDIRYLPVEGVGFHRRIGLCFRPTHPRQAFVQHCADTLRSWARDELDLGIEVPLQPTKDFMQY